jgi:hypothetical protein
MVVVRAISFFFPNASNKRVSPVIGENSPRRIFLNKSLPLVRQIITILQSCIAGLPLQIV